MKRRLLSSLRVRLVLLVLLAVVPSLVVVLYTGLEQRRLAANEVKAEALRFARFASSDKELLIEGARQFLTTLSQLPVLRSCDQTACNALFTNLLKQYPQYANIGLSRPDGYIFSSGLPIKDLVNAVDRSWFKRAMESRSFSIGDYQIGRITSKPSINFGCPVFDHADQIKAVVFVALDLTWLNQLVAKVPSSKGTEITVFDRNGTVLVRYPDPEKWIGKSVPEVTLIQTILSQGEGTTELPGLDGIPRLYAFTPLGGQRSAYVSIGVPKEAAFAAVDRVFTRSLLILGVLGLLALAAAWFAGDLLIMRRMNALLRATKRLEAGDLNARTELPYGHGELSQLSLSFDQMAESLQRREKETKGLSQENLVLSEIGQIISSTLKIEDIYERFAQEVVKLIPFDRIAISTINPEKGTTTVVYVFGLQIPGRSQGDVFPLTGTAAERCMKTRSGFILQIDEENETLAKMPGFLPALRAGIRSLAIVPLTSKDQVIGVLHLQSREPNFYKESHLKLAEKVANQIAGAVANALLYAAHEQVEEELQRVHRALKAIHECNHAIVSTTEESALLNNVCRTIIEAGGYRLAWVGLAEYNEEKTVRPVAQAGFEDGYLELLRITWEDTERGRGPTGTAIRTGKPSICKNIRTDPNYAPWRQEAAKRGYGSSIALPLIANDQSFGALNIYASESDSFDEEEVKLLTELAHDLSYGIVSLRMRTQHQQAEQKVKDLQQQLFLSQKMEAIGRLAGGIAHDFNNLLTIISGNSQLGLLASEESDPVKDNLEEIRKASDRAAALTRQLLAFSRRQVMEPRVLDLNAVLRDLDKMLHRIIGEDVDLVTIMAEELGRVKADPGQIEQVIMNLVINSRDVMPKGGKLTIETTNTMLDEAYARTHIAVKAGYYVRLSVSDTGIGMTPEVKEKIFEPFFTTKEKGKGTGLGLSTVYGIVKQSGGNIWVYSELGQGTTFKIYLPRVDEPLEEFKTKGGTEEIPRGSETILVVEDEEAVRKLAVQFLQKLGYTVLEAHTEDEALLLCQQEKEPIHLVLTDVVMPIMGGHQLVEQLRQERQDFKVLYMSGYTDDAIVRHGVLAKGVNFISKPIGYAGLARKVREVLDAEA